MPSTLQVSWSKPGIVNFLKLRGEIYYLTLNSTRGIHTFTVSDSVKILSGVVDNTYYSKTIIISLLATPLTDEYCRFFLLVCTTDFLDFCVTDKIKNVFNQASTHPSVPEGRKFTLSLDKRNVLG